jgi:hypothetical protein
MSRRLIRAERQSEHSSQQVHGGEGQPALFVEELLEDSRRHPGLLGQVLGGSPLIPDRDAR